MGLFSRRRPQQIDHPPVERTIYVRADADVVREQLAAYSGLWSPKRAEEHDLELGVAGAWTSIRLPDAVHPWQLHNLAFWMLDCPGLSGIGDEVIAESGPSTTHAGYRLVRDPELPDCLCGWDGRGGGWTVVVPLNEVVTPEEVPVPRALNVPSGFRSLGPVAVRLEDPGDDMNPTNSPTIDTRRAVRRRGSTLGSTYIDIY